MVRYFTDYLAYHKDKLCDGCKKNIYGSRFNCHSCHEYNLCEECYATANYGEANKWHNSNHAMKMIMSELDRKATPHHTSHCSGCRSDYYPGIRYACTECKDFDLCERCYSEYRYYPTDDYKSDHNESHKMVKHELENETHHSNKEVWTAMSIKMQNYFGRQLGSRDWDKIDKDIKEQWTNLGKKIGFALYGNPTIVPDDINGSRFGYSTEKEAQIKELRSWIYNLNKKQFNHNVISLNFIFVSFWSSKFQTMLPIIRIYRGQEQYSFFVEPNGRTYIGWDDFLDKNKFPEGEMCIPVNGWYITDENGFCDLSFRKSAECDASRQIAKGLDITATVAGVGATAVAVVGLFTPLAPVAATALTATALSTGGYGAARGTYKLVDRVKHDESINPFDNIESFFSWFTIIGSVFSMGSMAGVAIASRTASIGSTFGQSMRIAINTAISTSLGINVVGIFVNAIEKFENGDVPILDIFQLCASALFFSNEILTMQHASSIIREAHEAKLDEIRKQLPVEIQRVEFDRQMHKDQNGNVWKGKTGEMHGAEVTIGRLNEALKKADWQTLFGGQVLGSPAVVIFKEAAVDRAQHARLTRYDETGANNESTTTVLAIQPNEFDAHISQQGANSDKATLPGMYYGYDIHLGPDGNVISARPIRVANPQFSIRNGQANHYIGGERVELRNLPPHARIGVVFHGNVLNGFQFMTFTKNFSNVFERD